MLGQVGRHRVERVARKVGTRLTAVIVLVAASALTAGIVTSGAFESGDEPTGSSSSVGTASAAPGAGRESAQDPVVDPAVIARTERSTLAAQALEQGSQDVLGDVTRYRQVMLQAVMADLLPDLRASSPGTQVIAYQNFGAVRDDTDCGDPTEARPSGGLSLCQAKEHPEWFLRDTATGEPIRYADFGGALLAMDVTHPEYVAAWLDAVRTRVAVDGFDGLELDDVNQSVGHGIEGKIASLRDGELTPVSAQQYGQGVLAAMQTILPALREAGLRTVVNLDTRPWIPASRDFALQVGGLADALNLEFWMRFDGAQQRFGLAEPEPHWDDYVRFLEAAGRQGTPVIANARGDLARDGAYQQYARASFLLGWDGTPGSATMFISETTERQRDPFGPLWTTDPGTPTGPRTFDGEVFRRTFTDGLVLVNPTDQPRTAALEGSWLDALGERVSGSVVLAPRSGLTLRAS